MIHLYELGLCYLLFAAVIAVRLALYARAALDVYEWRYNGRSHRSTLIWWPLFWPLLLFRPKLVINPAGLFKAEWDLAAVPRELDRLRAKLPKCGRFITYKPYSSYGDIHGEFVLTTADVEHALIQKLNENPHLRNDHEGDLLNWVQGRDESLTEPQPVPDAWHRFQYISDDLIRDEKVIEVRCSECGSIPSGQLVRKDDSGKPGWNFNRIQCPAGHSLLSVETMHLQYVQPAE